MDVKRCVWAGQAAGAMWTYHDTEWGLPNHDDRHHFEFLVLEGAQAGLSWSTILNKRAGYRKNFADFDPAVERVILRCIEKDPAQRPSSASQVAAALPGGDPLAAAIAATPTIRRPRRIPIAGPR